MRCTTVLALASTFTLAASAAGQNVPPQVSAQGQPQPGRRITARDGDLVVVDHDARVGFVRRRQAAIRLIYNAAERWVVLLADFVPPNGAADGQVDYEYHWRQVDGAWPLDERSEGGAILEEYSTPNQGPPGFGIVLSSGRLQFINTSPAVQVIFTDPQALATFRYKGAGSMMVGRLTFDQAEAHAIQNVRRNPDSGTTIMQTPGGPGSVSVSASMTAGATASSADLNGPVRVGGNVRPPHKLHDVAVVYPEAMRASGVGGIVILEVVVEPDGSVRGAKVLRGLAEPLNAAALDAVKHWRYEPTVLAGAAVPVVMTVPVPIRP
jgi:TonB family protein